MRLNEVPEGTALAPVKRAVQAASLRERVQALLYEQDAAVDAVLPYIEMAQCGLTRPDQPLGAFFLAGPTGVGKTQLVSTLAEVLHGSSKSLLRIDCGGFSNEHEVARLVGAPPGYLGHRETSALFTQQKLRSITSSENNFSLVLFDEFEKAASSVQKILLSILDKAELKLGDNSVVNFEQSFVFFTSNLGTKEVTATEDRAVGFNGAGDEFRVLPPEALKRYALEAARRKLSPEFLNRIDEFCVFGRLSSVALGRIVQGYCDRVAERLRVAWELRSCSVVVDDAAIKWFLDRGSSVRWGARELQRLVERHVTHVVARTMRPEQGEGVACYRVYVKAGIVQVAGEFK